MEDKEVEKERKLAEKKKIYKKDNFTFLSLKKINVKSSLKENNFNKKNNFDVLTFCLSFFKKLM